MKKQKNIAIILSYINILSVNIVNFFYVPILLRKLGADEYGLFSLCSSLIDYLAVINLGYASAYVRFYTKYESEKSDGKIEQLNAVMLSIYIILGFFILAAGLFLALHVNLVIGNKFAKEDYKLASQLLVIMTINLAVTFPRSVFSAIITTHERFIFQRITDMFINLGIPVISICMLFMGYHTLGISIVMLVISAITLGTNIFYCVYNLQTRFNFHHIPCNIVKDVLLFSVFLLLQSMSDCMNWQVDKLILARVSGSVAITYYTVGAKINSMLQNFPSAIYNVYIPEVNRLIAQDKYNQNISYLFVKVGRIQFFVMAYLYTAFLLFGRQFINIWAGRGYESAYIVGALLAFGLLFQSPMMIGVLTMRAQNSNGVLNILYFAICVFNVLISIPLSIFYGEIGAALGSCIVLVFTWSFVSPYCFTRIGKMNMKMIMKKIYIDTLRIFIPFVALYIALKWVDMRGITPIILWGIIYTGIYWAGAYWFAMNLEEKDGLRKIYRKLLTTIKNTISKKKD